ncbi:hypothetical protein GGTG_04744 [Gaeumannomyces tritici R3-111a-1]|uniref:Uncharacterized protein n=1 Tax=Gaeumannomyces tritici (strain R3-111a-1) TaxID=644352 RepID=J3NTZ5_GAET3|nr:hypothetical protein GGTG_04744 [Gaeumannomyces tritici R3-111a-1]EJT79660.1 hypothetical protein GGTG_04744 [Gaeumannomyces tritici R3-111a-1]
MSKPTAEVEFKAALGTLSFPVGTAKMAFAQMAMTVKVGECECADGLGGTLVSRIRNVSAVDARYICLLGKPSQTGVPPGSTVQGR